LTVSFQAVLQPQDETNDFKIQDLLLARAAATSTVMAPAHSQAYLIC
jgi:hypothetical protein